MILIIIIIIVINITPPTRVCFAWSQYVNGITHKQLPMNFDEMFWRGGMRD